MAQAKEVVFYTKEKDWAECVEAKRFFAEHGIVYEAKDVVKNPPYMRELVQKYRVMKVPSIVIDGTLVVGFQQAKLKELLGI